MKKFLITSVLSVMTLLPGAELFFVPGWRTGYSSRAGCVRIMKYIWPECRITVKSWNSKVPLDEAQENAVQYSAQLKAEILAMPENRRRELVLVGHSIGAAIVLDILDMLASRDLTIKEAVLLGAPVPDDDRRIFRAAAAVRGFISITSFRGDAILKLFYPWFSGKPLGTAGWRFKHPKVFQLITKPEFSFTNHYAYIYLEQFGVFRDTLPPIPADVKLPGSCTAHFYDESGIFWQTVKQHGSWKLQKHICRNLRRITDDKNRVRCCGEKQKINKIFESVKVQLSAAGKK